MHADAKIYRYICMRSYISYLHGLVVILEIDPSPETIDSDFPLLAVSGDYEGREGFIMRVR
jgi:hypothetical protein